MNLKMKTHYSDICVKKHGHYPIPEGVIIYLFQGKETNQGIAGWFHLRNKKWYGDYFYLFEDEDSEKEIVDVLIDQINDTLAALEKEKK